jgi:hypothetical protein
MKTILARTAPLAVVALLVAGPAGAQIGVYDAKADLNAGHQYLKMVQDAVRQAQMLQMHIDALRHINPARAMAHYAGSWAPVNLFSCSPWARMYRNTLNLGTGEVEAYLASVVPAAVQCNSTLPPLYDAIDRQRKKLDNAAIDAMTALGVSRTDLRREDESFGAAMAFSHAGGEDERAETALLQKLAINTAHALPALRNLQRQNDALLQLLLAQAALYRDAQTEIVNGQLRREEIWDSYRAAIGAR